MDSTVGILLMLSCVMAYRPSLKERKLITEYHTLVRQRVSPPASDMQIMTYSVEMEDLAIDWTSRCKLNPPDAFMYPHFIGTTTNLAVVIGGKPVLKKVGKKWFSAKQNESTSVDPCKDNYHHYHKMVWSTSTQIGCAIGRCDHVAFDLQPPVYIVGCVYKTPHYDCHSSPYTHGRSCSQCPSGSACFRNQCVSK
uniref:SCP domain-containing protein n=1 Tax=Mesocestoides corti TaxID=53468 RepID=A0A5K3FBN4_MESCO